MSSEIITSNDLKKILASAFPARANTTITSITLPYTPPCNGLFLGMLRAAAQGRAYKQYSNTEPSLWDFYQVAGGYSTFASFVQAGKEIAQTATANISDAPYYFFVPLDGTSPLFGGSADAIIEQGTNYRKWSSGLAECWGSATIGSNSACRADFPITFVNVSSCVASCAYLSTGTYVAPTISVQPFTTYANFYARCATSTTTSPHTVYWEVKGTWK